MCSVVDMGSITHISEGTFIFLGLGLANIDGGAPCLCCSKAAGNLSKNFMYSMFLYVENVRKTDSKKIEPVVAGGLQ